MTTVALHRKAVRPAALHRKVVKKAPATRKVRAKRDPWTARDTLWFTGVGLGIFTVVFAFMFSLGKV